MTTLLDRDVEVRSLTALLDEVTRGAGRVAVIEGPPGIGKTSLLDDVARKATAAGHDVRTARCGEFERELAFGVVRQLFRVRPDNRAGAALADVPGDDPTPDFQVFHALYWLCVEAAAERPLVLAVDDAQWADAASLGWFRYLARRLMDVPVLLMLTIRSDDAAVAEEAVRDIVDGAAGSAIALGPLQVSATEQILSDVFGEQPDAAFSDACHRSAGGNPFLTTELARAMAGDGGRPRADETWKIASLRPQSIARSIDARLHRLPGAAQSLAQAAAIFGTEAEFRHAAALAGLTMDDAVDAADVLHGSWIVRSVDPLRFEHSVTRDAILADLSPARLARDHKRAADVLAAEAAPADRVAGHLLLATPVGDPGTTRWLVDAADVSLRRGAPEHACHYLERALVEPPPAGERWRVLWSLGRAEMLLARPSARERLLEAAESCDDPLQRSLVTADLVAATTAVGRLGEAYELLERSIATIDPVDVDVALRLERQLLGSAQMDHELAARARHRATALECLAGTTAAERATLAVVAFIRSNDGTPHETVLLLARSAFGGGAFLDDPIEDPSVLGLLSRVFANVGDIDTAARLVERCLDDGRQRGALATLAGATMSRAALLLTAGDVVGASEDVEALFTLLQGSSLFGLVAAAAALRVAVSIERGELDEATTLLDSIGMSGAVPAFGVLDQLLFYRGVLRGERGDIDAALDDLFELGRREAIAGHAYTVTQWRAAAAPLLAGTGRLDEARALLDEEQAICVRRGSPRPLAGVLRARAAIDRDGAVDALRGAVELLEHTPFRLDLARVQVELGAALRRANRRAEARPHLDLGTDLAFRCGAAALLERGQAELRATGARPRRPVVTGPDALTASERRVARLAAAGRTNPEIAQELFVSRKTVETHLGHVYRKLGITDRGALGAALPTVRQP